jgi:hypothetical protein
MRRREAKMAKKTNREWGCELLWLVTATASIQPHTTASIIEKRKGALIVDIESVNSLNVQGYAFQYRKRANLFILQREPLLKFIIT